MSGLRDRELLELAAKAAGFSIEYRENGNHFASYPVSQIWNPLTDDGDALRLAVKLKLNVHQGNEYVWVEDEGTTDVSDFNYPDPYAATRRAIVRAAAEIGKTMP